MVGGSLEFTTPLTPYGGGVALLSLGAYRDVGTTQCHCPLGGGGGSS